MEIRNISINEFNNQYNKIMGQFSFPLGGGARREDSDESDSVSVGDASKIVKVNCINVVQKKEGLAFEGRICKTPAITLRFKQENIKLANVVKSLLHFVNKRLRMADVDSVEIVKGKKKVTHNGTELGKDVNMSDFDDVSEVNIVMH